MHNRKADVFYDLIVFGSTGYTGKLCAEYIVTNLPTNLKWAIAGRSESKLLRIVEDLKRLNPNRTDAGQSLGLLNCTCG